MSDTSTKWHGPLEINGEKYWTVLQFCMETGKSDSVIRRLLSLGNRIRKLKSVRISNHVYIPFSELTDYSFTLPGPPTDRVIRYRLSSDGIAYEPYETITPEE